MMNKPGKTAPAPSKMRHFGEEHEFPDFLMDHFQEVLSLYAEQAGEEGFEDREKLMTWLRRSVASLDESRFEGQEADVRSELARVRQHPEQLIAQVIDLHVGLGPLERLLKDPSVKEIMINGLDATFLEQDGSIQDVGPLFRSEGQLMNILNRILAPLGRRIDFTSPMVDARLPDGSRLNAVIPPLAVEGPAVTIRKFSDSPLGIMDLVKLGAMSQEMAMFLDGCVQGRLNLIVSGGTGTGKTTLLNALTARVPDRERILTIEDTAELQISHPNRVRLEARSANMEGVGEVTIRDLVRNSLRMRPDRIVVGECRGGEALDMLQAMNTGHDGSMTTAHSNSPQDLIGRLEMMVMMAGFALPLPAVQRQIAGALDLIVQADRLEDNSRRITRITEVKGFGTDGVALTDLYRFVQEGHDDVGKVVGRHEACGEKAGLADRLARQGIELPGPSPTGALRPRLPEADTGPD